MRDPSSAREGDASDAARTHPQGLCASWRWIDDEGDGDGESISQIAEPARDRAPARATDQTDYRIAEHGHDDGVLANMDQPAIFTEDEYLPKCSFV